MPTALEVGIILLGFVSLVLLLALMILRAAKWDDELREELLRSFRDELEAEGRRVVQRHTEPKYRDEADFINTAIPLRRAK